MTDTMFNSTAPHAQFFELPNRRFHQIATMAMMNEITAMHQGLVSVIIPSFGMGRFIGDALASVAAQTYSEWEVIVVDDHGPEDGTHSVVKAFADTWPGKRVELLRHIENRGVSAARNTAIGVAKGEFLAFLDPDDLWFPDHLERSMQLFRSDAGLDVTTGPVEVHAHRQGGVVTWVRPRERWYFELFPETIALQNYIQPSATVLRRKAAEEVGGFDEDPDIQHIEDYDLWIRLIERGYKFGFIAAPTSVYVIHGRGATASMERMDRLHQKLRVKHYGYFRRSSVALQNRTIGQVDSVIVRMDRLERRVNGPLFRLAIAIDNILRSVKRRFFEQ